MVWIHGGSFNFSSASLPEYNGRNLAKRGMVVVTINYRLASLAAGSIGLHSLPARGAIRPASRWRVPACVTKITRRRQLTMHLTENPSSNCAGKEQWSDMAVVTATFTSVTAFGMLARVAVLAFHSLVLPRVCVLHDWLPRAQYACSPIYPMGIHF